MARVLFVYRYAGMGGVETSILAKASALRHIGVHCEAVFIQPYGHGSADLSLQPHVRVGVPVDQVRDLARDFDFVVVVDDPGVIQMLETADVRSTVVFETHTAIPASFERFHSAIASPVVRGVVVPCAFNRAVLRRSGVASAPIHVVPNAVDIDAFAISRSQPHPANECRRMLLWIGRLQKEKNLDAFLDVAQALLARDQNLGCLVVGDADDYDATVRRYLHGRPDAVAAATTFRRSVPLKEMPGVYRLARDTGGCLVITSLHESQPMIILEAMSSGCPVVAPDVGGIGELVIEGVTGRLYRSGELRSAGRAVAELLAPDRFKERARIVLNAQMRVRARHSFEAMAGRYLALLRAARRRAEEGRRTVVRSRPPVRGLVSIVLPVHDRPKLLRTAVASVLRQTYKKWELLIIDEGSTDETAAVCDDLADASPKVSSIHIRHTGKAGLARERGRLRARGEFIQYLDSDDLLHPRKLEIMVHALTNSRGELAYCHTRRYAIGQIPDDVPSRRTGVPLEAMLPGLLTGRLWHTHTPLYRRELCEAAGPWSDLSILEDFEYDMRIAGRKPRLVHCPVFLADARDHSGPRLSSLPVLKDPALLSEAVRAYGMIYDHAREAGVVRDAAEMRHFLEDVGALLAKCREFGLVAQEAACRRMIFGSAGPAAGPLPVAAGIEPLVKEIRVADGMDPVLDVRVTNRSGVTFREGDFPFGLSYHLLSADGATLQWDNPRVPFRNPLQPGESRVMKLRVVRPRDPGDYQVAIDVVWERVAWLQPPGAVSPIVRMTVL